ncbi:MAG: mechanosensitive ion channel [Bacteroides sp.]|nr:mechanosensitive ion channel [Bacteroides sp.]
MIVQQLTSDVLEQVTNEFVDQVMNEGTEGLSVWMEKLLDMGIELGGRIIWATLTFFIGRYLIRLINRIFTRILERRRVDAGVTSFLRSMIRILLTILLVISVIGILGINTTSFAALLASAGVAIGVALSGNLQNFAGGIVILLFKPYRVGDYIETSNASGTVREIQIFHTILNTSDNRTVYLPNSSMSSGAVTNYSRQSTRRLEWKFGIEYGEDYHKVENILREILVSDQRILEAPAPFIVLQALEESSVIVMARVWVYSEDYWNVYFDINKQVYETFNEKGISFPFPQLTVHS